jgi:hypothetical protein
MRWSSYICYPQLSLFILFNSLPVLDLQLSVTLLTKSPSLIRTRLSSNYLRFLRPTPLHLVH